MRLMKEKGIVHTTSECTLRGFTCAQAMWIQKWPPPRDCEDAKVRLAIIGASRRGGTFGSTLAWAHVKPRNVHSDVVCTMPSLSSGASSVRGVSWKIVALFGRTCRRDRIVTGISGSTLAPNAPSFFSRVVRAEVGAPIDEVLDDRHVAMLAAAINAVMRRSSAA